MKSTKYIETIVSNQWYFKITDYIDRLENNLDHIDYPEKTKKQQKHWFENMRENNIDWCISRQRKWGCPIPIEGEEDTMDTFVDSSFYFIRYCDPINEEEICSKGKYKQVDLCVGGNEHACAHLIYARFVNMVLYDNGYIPEEEPFKRVIHQGMILKDGEKMSKNKGNVVDPKEYHSDELRFYLMFINHYFEGGNWVDSNFKGITRFRNRFIEWMSRSGDDHIDTSDFEKKIDGYVESFKFNKVVSEFMIFVNKNRKKNIDNESKGKIIDIMRCFMPDIEKEI